MSLIDIVRDIKNSGLALLIRQFINNMLNDYGKMINLQIDSKNKNIDVEILLKGEKEIIIVQIEKYEVINNKGSNFIKFKNISASREWINVLIKNVLLPNSAPKNILFIDFKYAKIINLLI